MKAVPNACGRVQASQLSEYFEPFTGEPLGSSEQSWTAAVTLDWLHNNSSVAWRPGCCRRSWKLRGSLAVREPARTVASVAQVVIRAIGTRPRAESREGQCERSLPGRLRTGSSELAELTEALDASLSGEGGLIPDRRGRDRKVTIRREILVIAHTSTGVCGCSWSRSPTEQGPQLPTGHSLRRCCLAFETEQSLGERQIRPLVVRPECDRAHAGRPRPRRCFTTRAGRSRDPARPRSGP